MSSQRAARIQNVDDEAMLDVDTSAAILRWMETGRAPEGIEPGQWERWVDDGCHDRLEAGGMPVTPAMLGLWASTGTLR